MGNSPSQHEFSGQSLVTQFLDAANRHRASDIHVEPQGPKVSIRFRIDGRLRLWKELPLSHLTGINTRIKVLASMDIAEKRRPQDGRFTVDRGTPAQRDYRVSTVPQLEAEKIVIRILHKDLTQLDFNSLGYSEQNIKRYKELLSKPHGLLLHCGPTGSGKTTSLYTAINYLAREWRNIQTIEDPVEGRLLGINQAQINPETGLHFANLLRSILRQDCDIIMVGEIRDSETAQLAVQASLTGHLVLGTLHTNSAAGAISRLVDMEVPSFFVGTALIGVVSQRLVRRLCMRCRQAFRPAAKVMQGLGLGTENRLFEAVGCRDCGKLGYRGRFGIQEVLSVNDTLRDAIHDGKTVRELQVLAEKSGMTTILKDGVSKAVEGHTTVDEVMRVVRGTGVKIEQLSGVAHDLSEALDDLPELPDL